MNWVFNILFWGALALAIAGFFLNAGTRNLSLGSFLTGTKIDQPYDTGVLKKERALQDRHIQAVVDDNEWDMDLMRERMDSQKEKLADTQQKNRDQMRSLREKTEAQRLRMQQQMERLKGY